MGILISFPDVWRDTRNNATRLTAGESGSVIILPVVRVERQEEAVAAPPAAPAAPRRRRRRPPVSRS